MKTNQYYGLRLIKLIYNMLCLLVVITCLGGLGAISLQALNAVGTSYARFAVWLPQAAGLVIGGGLLALTFYVVAQIIEVQLSVNSKLNHVLKGMDDLPAAVKTVETSNKQVLDEMVKMRTELQSQARLLRLQNNPAVPPVVQSPLPSSTRTLPTTKTIP